MRKILIVLSFALLPLARPAGAAELLGTFENWEAYREVGGPPVCFAASTPLKEEGDYTKRGPTYVLVTRRPQEKSFDVVSVTAGYPYKESSEASIRIDSQEPVKLFTDGSDAWAYDGKEDARLVSLMKGGLTMIVRGTSARGTLTTDTYSLKGFTAAYEAIATACPR